MSHAHPHILLLQGPNLDLLGQREQPIYGNTTLAALHASLKDWGHTHGVTLTIAQVQEEGVLIAHLRRAAHDCDGVVINPGGYTHSGVALRDAIVATPVPVLEVHVSNLAAREPFRAHSLLAPVCDGTIFGMGVIGYQVALEAIVARIQRGES
jgi:3-dehydroquinate dehydratase II